MIELTCPLCKSRLNIRLDGFTCHEASGGPYLKGRIALSCSDRQRKCKYMHTTNIKTASKSVMRRLEQIVGNLIVKLPGLGPWEIFALKEGERKAKKPR